MSATLRDLRADLYAARAAGSPGRSADAYNRLAVAAAAAGRPLDGLRRHSLDEAERFFALTVPGPDGHVYWIGTGSRGFRRNDGSTRTPVRWWWEHRHGTALDRYWEHDMLCGDRACINPEHARFRPRDRKLYSDERMLGALQVVAMRLGRAPSPREWDAAGRKPHSGNYGLRFGSWTRAVRAAGLEPVGAGNLAEHPAKTREEVLDSVRFVRGLLGHFPSNSEFRAHAKELRAAGHPSSSATLYRRVGSWAVVRKALGL